MPRRKKKTVEPETPKPSVTYHKSKNGRYYKKTKLPNGKHQCRFVSKSEAEGTAVNKADKE